MKAVVLAIPLMLLATNAAAQEASDLEGEWSVDLRLSLEDAPYNQPMTIAIEEDGAVTGRFYGSDLIEGRAGAAQGRNCIAFRTSDGSGFYHTSACLVDGKMIGQTWSEGRNFVLPWTAERP